MTLGRRNGPGPLRPPPENVTMLAPPVPTYSVLVAGHLPQSVERRTFAFTYHNTLAPAAVAAAELDARRTFGTDTDAPVNIDQIFISN